VHALIAAFALLSRLPVPRLQGAWPPIARIVWAFPIVGAVLGATGGAVYAGCATLGLPSALAAISAVAALMLASGALHEDGLADMADGFGGGRTRERKLEIMRDSRIGSFGAIALMLAIAMRGVAMAEIGAPRHVLAAMIAAGALARASIALPLLLLSPARPDGMAAELRATPSFQAALALLIGIAAAILVLAPLPALRTTLGALAASLAVTMLARQNIGGYTGDVLGACAVAAECAALALIASR
jgi:adenosylcobinamide-GDP ribazoletransferase